MKNPYILVNDIALVATQAGGVALKYLNILPCMPQSFGAFETVLAMVLWGIPG